MSYIWDCSCSNFCLPLLRFASELGLALDTQTLSTFFLFYVGLFGYVVIPFQSKNQTR